MKVRKENRTILNFKGKHILIGITGGIAAYKIGYLVRDLIKSGAEVKVVMTEAATRFVAPLTFSTLSKNSVLTDFWNEAQKPDPKIPAIHIDIANWADIIVIAPASANTIAKLASGISDNLLTTIILASNCPVLIVPTMDAEMYLNEVTQKNLMILMERGYMAIQPEEGELASGLMGVGRLPEINIIIETISNVLSQSCKDLKNKNILVTAGPTYESIDPVRFIGNRSSGKMGFAIANAAAQRGAKVLLISGPTYLQTPRNVERINVESGQDMLEAIRTHSKKFHVIIMSAAVSDFKPAVTYTDKIKKQDKKEIELKLVPTIDILAELGKNKGKKILVGFALETKSDVSRAKEKMKEKKLDLIVLNSISRKNQVFGSDFNEVTILDRRGKIEKLPRLTKYDVANKILDRVASVL